MIAGLFPYIYIYIINNYISYRRYFIPFRAHFFQGQPVHPVSSPAVRGDFLADAPQDRASASCHFVGKCRWLRGLRRVFFGKGFVEDFGNSNFWQFLRRQPRFFGRFWTHFSVGSLVYNYRGQLLSLWMFVLDISN